MKGIQKIWLVLSFVGILLCTGCQQKQSSEPPPVSSTSQTSMDAAQKAEKLYEQKLRDLLREGKFGSKATTVYYDLYDLDDDGQRELIVSMGDAHPSVCRFYTCTDNTVTAIEGQCGSFGCIQYYPESGIIVGSYTGMGCISQEFYRLQDKQLDLLYKRTDGVMMNKTPVHSFNGHTVTNEELFALREEYETKYPLKGERIELGRGKCYTDEALAEQNSRKTSYEV